MSEGQLYVFVGSSGNRVKTPLARIIAGKIRRIRSARLCDGIGDRGPGDEIACEKRTLHMTPW